MIQRQCSIKNGSKVEIFTFLTSSEEILVEGHIDQVIQVVNAFQVLIVGFCVAIPKFTKDVEIFSIFFGDIVDEILHKEGVNVLDCIQTEALNPCCFDKPFSPLVEIFYNLGMFEIDIGVHEVIVVSVFLVYQISMGPTFVVPLDLVDPTFITWSIVVRTGEVVPMPVEVIIGAISAIKGEFGPSLNGEGLSENLVSIHGIDLNDLEFL